MEKVIERLMPLIPHHTAAAISEYISEDAQIGERTSEIRLRADRPTSITVSGKNVYRFHGKIDVCSEYEISQTVSKLTEDSVHTYGETIRQG
ncbi:MAG: hypothetical protein KBS59_07310, partial [Clostridiales bacterium]|nr:hypothetical protein [Clostridiales bacterium]